MPAAAEDLTRYLEGQRTATGPALPHRRRLLVERVRDPQAADPRPRVVLHTMWGGQVNRPFAMALAAAWEERFGTRLQVTHDDDALALELPHEMPGDDLLSLVESERLLPLLRRRLESSGFFGARFRENAGRALLLPRGDQRHRVPLWLNRQRSKRLLDAVRTFPDFPLLLETWRTCLQDEMDLGTLRDLLGEVERGEIEVVEVMTSKPSPFAANLGWKQTNKLMYEDDTPEGGPSRLGDDLLAEVTLSAALRPRVPPAAAEELRRKLQRTWPGYAPAPDEVADWVRERCCCRSASGASCRCGGARRGARGGRAVGGARAVAAAMVALALTKRNRDSDEAEPAAGPQPPMTRGSSPPSSCCHGCSPCSGSTTPRSRGAAVRTRQTTRRRRSTRAPGARAPRLAPRARRARSGARRAARGVAPLLRTARTRSARRIWRLEPERLVPLLDELVDAERIVVGELLAGIDVVQVCDAENLGRLLRMVRARGAAAAAAAAAGAPLFLAVQRGLAPRRDGIDGLQSALERLFGWAAPAASWETDLLPARLEPYHPAWLDTLLQETDLLWLGVGKERLTFAFPEDVPLLRPGGWTVDAAALEEERGAGEVDGEESECRRQRRRERSHRR